MTAGSETLGVLLTTLIDFPKHASGVRTEGKMGETQTAHVPPRL